MYLFFYTETDGLPRNYGASMQELDNWPRVIQLAWAMYNEKQELVEENVDLILPDGWTVPDKKFWIDNGFSQAQSIKDGIKIVSALHKFSDQIEMAKMLIAHNIDFDYNITGAEFLRARIRCVNKPKQYCTMKETVNLCKLPGKYKKQEYKWPKLVELHEHLFGVGFEGAHDALVDVRACAKCYFRLKEMQVAA